MFMKSMKTQIEERERQYVPETRAQTPKISFLEAASAKKMCRLRKRQPRKRRQ